MFGVVFITDIEIIIILWNKVYIVQKEAVPVIILHGLTDANIKEFCLVKWTVSSLERECATHY